VEPTYSPTYLARVPPVSDQRFAGAPFIACDGRVYLGSHPHGNLFSFDPANDRWRDCGGQAPEPIIDGQHIWCYPSSETEQNEIICVLCVLPFMSTSTFRLRNTHP
jgi:hypothetical protein